MPRVIEPTDELLREACARMARRFRWTDGFDAVMQDPTRSRLVRIAAKHPSAAGWSDARAPRPAPAPHHAPQPNGVPLFDRKRAASGERDDD